MHLLRDELGGFIFLMQKRFKSWFSIKKSYPEQLEEQFTVDEFNPSVAEF